LSLAEFSVSSKLKDMIFNGNIHASRMLMWMCSSVMLTFLLNIRCQLDRPKLHN